MGTRGVASAADGHPLAVTRFPAEGQAWATVLFGSAMGVRQDFYAPFARFLAAKGVHVLTFDYRGTGWSLRGKPRDVDASLSDMIPVLTPLFGYFPGKRLRMVGDLPRGVAYQWRRWCLHPEYLLAEGEGARQSFQRVTAPILSYSFDDDPIITRPAIESLNGFYRKARVEHRHIAAPEGGERPIGHFGFFLERSRATLWSDALEWLRAQAAPKQPRPEPYKMELNSDTRN